MIKENLLWEEQPLTGRLEYRLTNDFMFKAVLQENETALRGLLCALLGMEPERIRTVRVMNPIEIGKKIEDKLMMLDLKLEMNDDCIMDYYFYNLDTAHKYSDKMSIRVLQLNQLGKDEDEACMPELYRWAQLFKAETWEEMRMLAEKNAAIKECVVTYKELTADERARMEAEAREDYYRCQKDLELYAVTRHFIADEKSILFSTV